MEYTLPDSSWTIALADLVNLTKDGDVIWVQNVARKELGKRVLERMYTEKKLEFRVEEEILDKGCSDVLL